MTRLRALLERPWLPAFGLFCLATLWFAARCVHGIHFMTFTDESGHLVGARAIAAGDRLYRDFINAHGPLCFMVAHAFGVLFGWEEPLDAPWTIVAFVVMGAASVTASPVLRTPASRLWGGALFLGLVAAPWLVQGLYLVNYHVLGGVMTTVALAWLVVPLWAGLPVPRWQAAAAGAALSALCAAAYALAPSALLLAASGALAAWGGLPRARARPIMAALAWGFAGGCLLILAWLLKFGDVVGFLVFHFIDNQVNYSRYGGFGWNKVVRSLAPDFSPVALVQTGASAAFCVAFATLAPRRGGRGLAWRRAAWALGIGAFLMLNSRGLRLFQDGSFLVACMGALALGLAAPAGGLRRPWAITLGFGLLLAAYEATDRMALASPSGAARAAYESWPPFSLRVRPDLSITQRIRHILRPGERLLVLVYDPDVFLMTGTLPMRKYADYLPWEADYARAPWFGRERDLCKDILAEPPPVIRYDGWKVWDRYDPLAFMPCVPALLAQDYVADAVPGFYIRKARLLF